MRCSSKKAARNADRDVEVIPIRISIYSEQRGGSYREKRRIRNHPARNSPPAASAKGAHPPPPVFGRLLVLRESRRFFPEAGILLLTEFPTLAIPFVTLGGRMLLMDTPW